MTSIVIKDNALYVDSMISFDIGHCYVPDTYSFKLIKVPNDGPYVDESNTERVLYVTGAGAAGEMQVQAFSLTIAKLKKQTLSDYIGDMKGKVLDPAEVDDTVVLYITDKGNVYIAQLLPIEDLQCYGWTLEKLDLSTPVYFGQIVGWVDLFKRSHPSMIENFDRLSGDDQIRFTASQEPGTGGPVLKIALDNPYVHETLPEPQTPPKMTVQIRKQVHVS